MAYIKIVLLTNLASFFSTLGQDNVAAVSRDEFEILKNTLMRHAKRIDELEKLTEKQNEKLSLQEDIIYKLKERLGKKVPDITTFQNKQQPNEITGRQIHNQQSWVKKEMVSKEKRIIPSSSTAVIAFYAYMSKSEVNPGKHHILVYDHEITNSGHAYNKHSGSFVAPSAGLYVFTWNTFTSNDNGQDEMGIEIVLNSQAVGVTFVYGSGPYGGVTGTVVLNLNKDDTVFTRTSSLYEPRGSIRSDSIMKSTFSGWRLS